MVDSFIEYWEAVKTIVCNDDEVLFFRGLPNVDYDLLPSAFRSGAQSEEDMYNSVFMECPEEFKKNEHLSNLVKIQHYGGISRLLDISGNPLIGLYFACEMQPDTDGKVVVFRVSKSAVLHHTSDKALMLSCLPLLKNSDREEIKQFCERHRGQIGDEDICFNVPMRKLMHEIRSEFPAFGTEIIGEDLLKCWFVRPNKDNERMKVQDGAFVIYGLDQEANQRYLESISEEIVINASAKKEILKDLRLMHISVSTIYPGLEARAKDILKKRLNWTDISVD